MGQARHTNMVLVVSKITGVLAICAAQANRTRNSLCTDHEWDGCKQACRQEMEKGMKQLAEIWK